MKLLIMQPKLEKTILQLKDVVKHHDVDMVIFPEGYLNENLEEARQLARETHTILAGGHRRMDHQPKDYALLIDATGEVQIDRQKYTPITAVTINNVTMGHILCDELILQGLKTESEQSIELIIHPIGVGMFSQAQFTEWVEKARQIATEHQVMVIGVSHRDGMFKGASESIPIAYGFQSDGSELFIANNDPRSRMIDLTTKKVSMIEEVAP
ncbi:hypothetical protein [Alkalicoccobacillus porphyridii]|uniref:CN hydrolase domain-containing protein n=1 Tax=Alkalicoccobacillus porphyridii TaxID=2597270 RepID=A0A553ZXC1_9BACI|nr:hypothetical protein [Alkalicoccobacillus porphyridii]TSB45996.1 hypothetical protein FN960_13915 [Alkalicoccobacillus porphyridii]